jgi:FkbM family methyltransferase
MTYPIVMPLHRRGGKFGDDREAKIAVRSIKAHFKDAFELHIVSYKPPAWADCGFIPDGGKGLKTALRMAADRLPEGFFWWYDDTVLLRDQTAEELKVTFACRKWQAARTSWSRRLEQIRQRCLKEGIVPWDYSRPHGPYWFDKSMIDEAFADWPGMKGKFPFESWILSKRNWPRRHGGVRQYYGPFTRPPREEDVLLNYNDRGNTPQLRGWLGARFPGEQVPAVPCPRDEQWRYLHGVWTEHDSPSLRTVCECSVGPNSHVAVYREVCDRVLLIEPHPRFAAKIREEYPWADLREVAVGPDFGTTDLACVKGSSFTTNVGWAPIHHKNPKQASAANRIRVGMVPFDALDDGQIDLINLDCEGSEWEVIKGMRSRPRFLQIELYSRHTHYAEITEWLEREHYRVVLSWGNSNLILVRDGPSDSPLVKQNSNS